MEAATLDDQRRIVAIPGPTGAEGQRAAFIASRLREIGFAEVSIDQVGNVVGCLPRITPPSDPRPIVVAAHLDTVFPADSPLSVRRTGRRIAAPGISDNARGLAGILTLAQVMHQADVETARPVLFVATVGEEGTGDLRGVKHLFREGSPLREAAAFIAVDGPGRDRIVTRAIGSLRYRATISGSGGHSWGDRGMANAVHGLGLAIARLRAVGAKMGPDVALNVGRLGGGTSVNSIPEQAWMEIDLRGSDRTSLLRVERDVLDAVEFAVSEENRASKGRGMLTLEMTRIGDRPAGETPVDSPVVQAAIAATRAVGGNPDLAASSTDANVPISLGIPSIAIGAGGAGGRTHTLDEWYEDEGGPFGIERAALVVYSVAGIIQREG